MARKIWRLLSFTVLWVAVVLSALAAVFIGFEIVSTRFLGNPSMVTFLLHELPFRGERFDKTKWESAFDCTGLQDCESIEYSCPRGPMVQDLIESRLSGDSVNRAYVESLLGSKEYDLNIRGEDCSGYHLGWCSGFQIDPDSLFVCYGDEEILEKIGHYQH